MRRRAACGSALRVQSDRLAFIDIGRVVAAIAIIYAHIDVLLLRENLHRATAVTDAIDHAAGFLGIGPYGLGHASVPFFFLISGFVVTRLAETLGPSKFVIKQCLLRVLPLLTVAVVLSTLALKAGLRPLTTGPVLPVQLSDVLQNFALVNFLHKPIIAQSGVSWSLLPEIIFYFVLIATVPLLRRRMWLAPAVEIIFVAVVLALHAAFGPVFRSFAANTAYVTLAFLGQIAAAGVQRRLPAWLALLYAAAAFGLYVWAVTLNIDPDYSLPLRAVVIAIALFAIGLLAEPRLHAHPVWIALSDRTYALYLLHGAIAFPVIFKLYGVVPLGVAVFGGVAAMLVGVELAHRLIERPLNDLGRRLANGLRAAPSDKPQIGATRSLGAGKNAELQNATSLERR